MVYGKVCCSIQMSSTRLVALGTSDCGMRGISGNILQIVSLIHLFTTIYHILVSLILKIPRYFKVIKGQILKYQKTADG